MVNKKVPRTSPQSSAASPAAPQRKAATATAKRPERPAAAGGGGGPPPKPPAAQRVAPPRPSAMATRLEGLQKTFRETVAELKKVQWPDRTTTRNLTLVVIAMSTVLAAILGLLDAGLTWVIEWLVRTV